MLARSLSKRIFSVSYRIQFHQGAKMPFSTAVVGSFLLTSDTEKSAAVKAFEESQNKKRSKKADAPKTNADVGYELIKLRNNQMGPNVSVFYKQDGGLVVTRGKGMNMYDVDGKAYLDFANNVACVGHSHPKVVKAGCEALHHIQTNGRFLHPTTQRYLTKLLATFPPELNTVYLVNSGSEANDLALRIAREHTNKTAKKSQDVIVLDSAYHGHTQTIVDISPYKWKQAIDGKNYQPQTTHVVSCPDSFRGKFRGVDTGAAYAKEVEDIVNKTGGVGTFIAESIVGCGGQIIMPTGYLEAVYKSVRAAGGVCIADEVQTGFARMGTTFWGFEQYNVIPDIVTIGKPMGNGYPVAAVVCKRELANSFAATGIEYFNTYGGNSVACSIAESVLDTIHDEKLQHNADVIGKHFSTEMKKMQKRNKWIGDVRGIGLFQGVEFVKKHRGKEIIPHPELTKFVVDYLKLSGIIISRDGPDGNVIKFKPPLVINEKHVNVLVRGIGKALKAAKKVFSQ